MARKVLHTILVWLVRLLFNVSVTGIEHVPPSGPLILIINHIAFLDPVLITAVFPREVVSLTKVEVLSLPVWGPLVRRYGVVSIQRGQGDIAAVRQAIDLVSSGRTLLIAPEGTRSSTYRLQTGKKGLVTIATRTKAAIIPAAITGAHQVKRNWLRLRRPPIEVTIGQPFLFRPAARRRRQPATDEAMYRLAEILPEPFRGVYGDLSQKTGLYTSTVGADQMQAPTDGVSSNPALDAPGQQPQPG
jgi:1-acyl-sn-glycerol-3-phosphate acyltransferase